MREDGDDFAARDRHWHDSSVTFVPGRMADSCQIRKQPVGVRGCWTRRSARPEACSRLTNQHYSRHRQFICLSMYCTEDSVLCIV